MTRGLLQTLVSAILVCAIMGGVWFWILKPVISATNPSAAGPIVVLHPTDTQQTTANDQARNAVVEARAADFLTRWTRRDYAGMYSLLDASSQAHISKDHFTTRYGAIATEATITNIAYHIRDVHVTIPQAVVHYHVRITTSGVGIIYQDNTMTLQSNKGNWRVHWTPSLIFSQLRDPYYIRMIPAIPTRGAIYDSSGQPLAALGSKVEVDVVPGWITDEKKLLAFLSTWLHMTPAAIKAKYSWGQPDWRMPITYVSSSARAAGGQPLLDALNNGLELIDTPARIYPQNSLASDVLGYVQNGHGVMGLEASQDATLGGRSGLTLAVVTAPADDATVIAKIAQTPAVQGLDVHVTLNTGVQQAAEKALGNRNGAIVAINTRTGAIVAMVSHPGFDPNAFTFGVPQSVWDTWNSSSQRAFFNRATSGTYPLGSVFKIVSMAAAMEKGGYTINSTFDSTGTWTGLGWANVRHDWLAGGHGIINLHEALVQSCDDCFYDVGKHLDQLDPTILPSFGRAFGLGVPTGIQGLAEATGVMPDPAWKKQTIGESWWPGDSVNLAIGQGYLLVTPLQVANMLASVADGGTIHRPYIVASINQPDGTPVKTTTPQVTGHLPASQATLNAIKNAMLGVTTEPFGTAILDFRYYPHSVLGKTGTAEASTGSGNPDAWFAAITPADHPQLAVAVEIDNGGEGSMVAAPIARDVLTAYYQHVNTNQAPQQTKIQVP